MLDICKKTNPFSFAVQFFLCPLKVLIATFCYSLIMHGQFATDFSVVLLKITGQAGITGTHLLRAEVVRALQEPVFNPTTV
jgi:hypothetical protein